MRRSKLLVILAALSVATLSQAQSLSAAYLGGKGPNGLYDTYVGVLQVGRTFQPPASSIVGKYLPKLSFELDGFAGTGMQYKLNILNVSALAKYAISPTFAFDLGIWQTGDINNFSFEQLNIKNASLFVGISVSAGNK